jgi:hypothetical protein
MSEQNNGQALPVPQHKQHLPNGHQARYTAETVLRTRPATYRKVVALLADPNWSKNRICRACRVTEHTVNAIEKREQAEITERKTSLAAILSDVAEIGAHRMVKTIGKASMRDAAIGTGISIDKYLALLGQSPAVQIANVIMPSEAERAERRAMHDKLDAIARRLMEPCEPKP